jgi:L-asparaginase / beta-aspartyl-peptidase
MIRILMVVALLALVAPVQAQHSNVAIAIHGGAGTILPENMDAETEAEYRAALEEALRAGYDVLNQGGSSLDAVVAAVQIMEESPLFNAGRGAVFTADERHELDASIMEGRNRNAGAVAAVSHVRSPIQLARLIMEESPHVMMVGDGAETFAWQHNMERVENEYFNTERRRQQLHRMQRSANELQPEVDVTDRYFGTVGAVALDRNGDLAAATSTGGMSNKKFGRVGDSPIIGAGTYADNETVAVSATGHGEYFIRGIIAYDIAAMMRYGNLGVTEAANAVIHGKLTDMGATGGVIAMDRNGNVSMPFNTAGMYRGVIGTDGQISIEIFR